MKRAAIYVRVSTAAKSKQIDTVNFVQNLEVQEQPLRDLVQQRGWQFQQLYSDRASGAKEKRPGWITPTQMAIGVTTVRRAYQSMKAKRGVPKPGGWILANNVARLPEERCYSALRPVVKTLTLFPAMGINGVARPDIKKDRAAGERWSAIAQRAEFPERD